jgi:wyosine [tRNA(Phe)-imidazoG37] synthetase (radical SAM superfamily)
MSTFLFDETIFGPVISRRLGVSLGINLLPNNRKLCTFDCVYCECGWNPKGMNLKAQMPNAQEVSELLEQKLQQMAAAGQLPDVITFAGNGEPTIHPQFAEIVDQTLALRNHWAPKARIAVLSNATMLHKPAVFEALMKVDDPILKLDGGTTQTIQAIDQPVKPFDLEETVALLEHFGSKAIIQTLFVRGTHNGISFDNTTAPEVEAWIAHLQRINPAKVMIYTIARDTPAADLTKISPAELDAIAVWGHRMTDLHIEVSY